MKQQRGGTLLGLIVGVVVGLTVALLVAVYVTKVPVPFMNKGSVRTPEQDAAEEKHNKDWNPNAPLFNKTTPRAPDTTDSDTTSGDKAATAPSGKTGGKTATKPAVSADPLGDLARAKAAASGPVDYFVQVGAYSTAADAETQRAKLSLTGVEAKVTQLDQGGRQIFRVRVGPYDNKDDAAKVKSRLEAAGQETQLVPVRR